MKYLYSWLKDYYQTDNSVELTGENLVSLGSDVEEATSFPQIDERVIAVKITKIEAHPNADKLRLPTVTDGEKEITIVCGAPNIEVGQIVPLAQIGTKIGDMEIGEAEIRGVKSSGMLCSERELGLSDEHTGIKILSGDTELGTKVKDILTKDSILELEITPNRGDLLSHFGLARDLSAKSGRLIEKPALELNESSEVSDKIKVSIESAKCPVYLARVISGIKIAESPDWLKDRLIAVGAKPINNVVDVTNYIMLDLGHPLHAFDASKIVGSEIIVKEVGADMDVVTLDGEARVVIPEMLGIWDKNQMVAIAGVMGLKNSEVDQNTTEIVLEAAVFERKSIRKTAKLLNLRTEASARFERGVDADGVEYAINKATKLIAEIAGGEVSTLIKAESESGTKNNLTAMLSAQLMQAGELNIEYQKINQFAGLNLSNEQIDNILQNLGFEIKEGQAIVPAWRHDISIWQDLAEEVYRINGLDKIEKIALPEVEKLDPVRDSLRSGVSGEDEVLSELVSISNGARPRDYYKKEKIKDYLVELGLDEAISYTFLSDADVVAAKLDPTDLLEVANPVQDENRYLRNSLIPGLLKAVAKNPSFDDVEFFEIGSVFTKNDEWMSLGIATSGKSSKPIEKIVESLCGMFNFDRNAFNIYEISQEELVRFKIKKPYVMVAEAKIDDMLKTGQFDDLDLIVTNERTAYRPISKYPPAKRDLAFVVDSKVSSGEIKKTILETAPEAVLVELFDEFESDKLGIGKKSVAYRIYLQELDKTMADAESDEIISKIIESLKQKFGAELRS